MIPSVFARPWRSQTTCRTRRRRGPSRLRGLFRSVELRSRQGSPHGVQLILNELNALQDAVEIGARKLRIRNVQNLNFPSRIAEQMAQHGKWTIAFSSIA